MRGAVFFLVLAACTEHGKGGDPLPDAAIGDPPIGDPPPKADPCDLCGSTELCVQSYDGNCKETTACIPQTVDCPNNACSVECEQTYCSSPFQCMNRAPCGTESPSSFTCYGP